MYWSLLEQECSAEGGGSLKSQSQSNKFEQHQSRSVAVWSGLVYLHKRQQYVGTARSKSLPHVVFRKADLNSSQV